MTFTFTSIASWIELIANAISIMTAIIAAVRATTAIARRIIRERTRRRVKTRHRNARQKHGSRPARKRGGRLPVAYSTNREYARKTVADRLIRHSSRSR